MDASVLYVSNTTVHLKRQQSSYASDISHRLYLNQRSANVFFTFPNSSERIPAHKFILAMASCVFDQMFYGSSPVVTGDVLIAGHTPDTFKDFLKFFYLAEFTLKANNITDVVHLLHAYKMPKCLELCTRFWLKHYDDGNINDICMAYELAIKFQMAKFQERCEHKIAIHFAEVLKTDTFLSSSFGVLHRILGFDSLLCDESVVLGACLDWARYKCKENGKDENNMENLREYLIDSSNGANLLHKIRYVSISHNDYSMHLDAIYAVLTDMERKDVNRLVLGSTAVETNKFRTEPRKPFWNDEKAIDYVLPKDETGPEFEVDEQHVHVLKTNQCVLFGGFYIVRMKAINLRSHLISINVSIEEKRIGIAHNEKKMVHTERVTVTENVNEFVQLKPNPVVMKPECEYHIAFDFKLNQHGDAFDHITFSNEVVELNHEIKLSDNLTIQYSSDIGKKGRLLMKGFKLMQL